MRQSLQQLKMLAAASWLVEVPRRMRAVVVVVVVSWRLVVGWKKLEAVGTRGALVWVWLMLGEERPTIEAHQLKMAG
jgi:hypothetical protein